MEDLLKEITRALDDVDKRREEEWDNKTNEEKLSYYEKNNVFLAKYIRMSKEELEKELEFYKHKAEQLRGVFKDPMYSYTGCLDAIQNIELIKRLKGW